MDALNSGFLPRSPLQRLPDKFRALDDLAEEFPGLIVAGSKCLRSALNSFPLIDVGGLKRDERMRARMIYGFAQSAYVKSEPEENHSPKNLAIPLHALSSRSSKERPLMLDYEGYVLCNWRLIDRNIPFGPDNLVPLMTFTEDKQDEKGFILSHVIIEHKASLGISSSGRLAHEIARDNVEGVGIVLQNIGLSLKMMYDELVQMPKRCGPDVYYRDIRPWLGTFSDVMFEGVNHYNQEPQTFRGASGAQSSVMPSFDAVLGVRHSLNKFYKSLLDLRSYMPPLHRAFIEDIETAPPHRCVRNYVLERKSTHPELIKAYNANITRLVEFRVKHTEFLWLYIIGKGVSPEGTGGTMFNPEIETMIKETKLCYVN